MLQKLRPDGSDGRLLLKAIVYWAVSALVLLCIFAGVLAHMNVGENSIAYTSSLLSFLAAACAGGVVGREKGEEIIYPALLTSAVLVTILLTVGFMVEGSDLESGGVLSVVSFSFAGCLMGAAIFMGKKQKKHKTRYRK